MAEFVCDGYRDCGAGDDSDEKNCGGLWSALSANNVYIIPSMQCQTGIPRNTKKKLYAIIDGVCLWISK